VAPLARRLLAAALIAALAAGPAGAERVRYYPAGSTPDARVVASILGHGKAPRPVMKMRGGAPALDEPAAQRANPDDGGRIVGDNPAVHEARLAASARNAVQSWETRATAARPAPAEPPAALALAIGFDNDSARLQSSALRSLDAVADGLRLAGASVKVLIEGHTSATGAWDHNLRLSQARAESVKRYLIQRHHIPAASLRTVGLGPTAPLDAAHPNAADNRRVQFRGA
jgi:outer membrane protein OmpA-like peptidoglycan-associated protein